MKPWIVLLCLLLACGSLQANAGVWQPAGGRAQLQLWPGAVPDAQPMPGPETETLRTEHQIADRPWMAVTNVSRPTLTVYAPGGRNAGVAVVVFPGGGFQVLAIDLEGTEICDWLTSRGITCVLLKYRVPGTPYDWRRRTYPDDFALSVPSLQDAQRAIRLVRFHASQWHVDPHKIGVIGFSAGGFLVAETSTDFKRRTYKPVDAADKESDRPDFAMAIYPGHLALDDGRLNPNVPVIHETPPTFLVQAEDDYTDGVDQALVYYTTLAKARVPAELHLYAHGGHAFGLRHTRLPITGWPALAEAWMQTIGVLPH
ncbi:alpha/beta hydrolase [Rhodanobacter sp. Si-c]|uniref:Alpha/beta hydrolase n=1 Tax=Rhodanobacter lycopersici TaxID=3162487 RepID=A0ABV3QEC0_9GAMM